MPTEWSNLYEVQEQEKLVYAYSCQKSGHPLWEVAQGGGAGNVMFFHLDGGFTHTHTRTHAHTHF